MECSAFLLCLYSLSYIVHYYKIVCTRVQNWRNYYVNRENRVHYLGLKNSLVHSNLIVVHYAVHYHVLQSLTLYRILLTLINIFVLLLYRYL